jgi:hypothetical protein
VELLEAAAAEAGGGELAREPETVAAIRAALRSPVLEDVASPRRSFNMPIALSRTRLAAIAAAAAFAATVGMASAGSLPAAAQDVASNMLAKVGITVPGPNDNAGTDPGERNDSPSSPVTPAEAGKGVEISELARTTDLTGVEKGAAVSTAASEGKSKAGQHGSASGAGAGAGAPVETPNGGGTGTADAASGGKSSAGTATADGASGGRSVAGSGNAQNGPETADAASGGHASSGRSHKP